MKSTEPSDRAWLRLARLASEAPPADEALPPPGFATRVATRWKEHRGAAEGGAMALFEWLTLRGLAVAVFILLGSAAFGYDSLLGVFTGDAALAGGWFDSLLTL